LRATELALYRKAAAQWIRESRSNKTADTAIKWLDALLASTDGVRWTASLRHRHAADKTRIVLARLRVSGVGGARLLEVALAVAALLQQRGITSQPYLLTQLAKVLLRMHVPTTWREGEGSNRSEGRYLRVLGRNVWFFAFTVATPEVLSNIGGRARLGMTLAVKTEIKRKAKYAVRRRTEDAIARVILREREWGAGPQDLADLEARLQQQYGLGSRRHA
jgi:hypothetical protein